MYKFDRNHQCSLSDFDQPMGLKMNPDNRWVEKFTTDYIDVVLIIFTHRYIITSCTRIIFFIIPGCKKLHMMIQLLSQNSGLPCTYYTICKIKNTYYFASNNIPDRRIVFKAVRVFASCKLITTLQLLFCYWINFTAYSGKKAL